MAQCNIVQLLQGQLEAAHLVTRFLEPRCRLREGEGLAAQLIRNLSTTLRQ